MNEILDAPENQPVRSQVFSKLSFVTGIISVLIILLMLVLAFGANSTSFLLLLACILIWCVLLGSIASVVSFYRREPHTFRKWTGACINLLFLLLFLMILAIIML